MAKNQLRHVALTAGDLFAGAGGLSEGFRQAGFNVLFGNDCDPWAARTYQLNHPGSTFFDCKIEDLSAKDIFDRTGLEPGELDLLLGGPPCQGFSINAPKRSPKDPRNDLFRHYVRLVLEGLKPKAIVMENVPGLLSLNGGEALKRIYKAFDAAGYTLAHMILCAAHYGIPQERWRLFFIGTRLKNAAPRFPFPTHRAIVRANFTGGRSLTFQGLLSADLPLLGELKPHVTVHEAISDLPPLKNGEGTEEMDYPGPPESPYQAMLRKGSTKIYNHVAPRLAPINLERLKYIKPGGSWRDIPHRLLPAGQKRARRSDHTRRYGRLAPDGLACTILTKCDPHWGAYFHPDQRRSITVREAARFQSFPDRYRFFGPRVSQYVQVGNAVPPLLALALAKTLLQTIFLTDAQEVAAVGSR